MYFLNISLPYKLSNTENTKVNEHFCFRSYDLVKNAVKKIMGFLTQHGYKIFNV